MSRDPTKETAVSIGAGPLDPLAGLPPMLLSAFGIMWPMERTRRALAWDEPEEYDAEEAYRIYQAAFADALTVSLVQAARSRSHEIYIKFRTELDRAKDAVEEGARLRRTHGVGWFDPLLVSWLRAYRAIEWYQAQLGTAIATAVTEPFRSYLKPDSQITAREFFRPAALAGLRDAVLTAMFDPEPFVQKVQEFFGSFRQTRHKVVHEDYQPQLDETNACVTAAIAIYNLADHQLNRLHTTPLDAPDFS